jgi:hypothetical protein
MKIKASEIKTAQTGYLYPDGHLIIIHEKYDKQAGQVQWATAYEDAGIKLYTPNSEGRLIMSRGALQLILKTINWIRVDRGIDQGSIKTKEMGLFVEGISLKGPGMTDYFDITSFPGTITSDIYWNEISETWDNAKKQIFWGNARISKKHETKKT